MLDADAAKNVKRNYHMKREGTRENKIHEERLQEERFQEEGLQEE